jgi:hypothetical protein
LPLRADARHAPIFHLPARDYYLLAGSVEAVSETTAERSHYQSPNLWWPDDHAWCVATEIDLNTTYMGCDDACLDEILALGRSRRCRSTLRPESTTAAIS